MPQDRERQGGHHRLVQVDQVELLLLQESFGLQVGAQRDGDARHRAIGGNGHHTPDAVNPRLMQVLGFALVVGGWRHDVDVMAARGELLGEIRYVLGDAARVCEIIR